MAATLTVIWWRDIPAQVNARDGREAHRVVLDQRFQVAIDAAAMKAGKNTADDYIEEWRREGRDCGPDLEGEAKAEAERLDAAYPDERLNRLARAGGFDTDKEAGPSGDGSPSKEPG